MLHVDKIINGYSWDKVGGTLSSLQCKFKVLGNKADELKKVFNLGEAPKMLEIKVNRKADGFEMRTSDEEFFMPIEKMDLSAFKKTLANGSTEDAPKLKLIHRAVNYLCFIMEKVASDDHKTFYDSVFARKEMEIMQKADKYLHKLVNNPQKPMKVKDLPSKKKIIA